MPTERVDSGGSSPTLALALGAGGARGLAHIVLLEALDELGIQPTAIAGTSMGAIIGAAYAAGVPGREIRRHALAMSRNRSQAMGRVLKARVGRFVDILSRGLTNPVLVDAEILLEMFWPEGMPARFDGLSIPLQVVATDYLARQEAVFAAGPLAPAVGGSMAIPGLVRPIELDGRVLIDGGAVNPLPYDLLFGAADVVVACDVLGGPSETGRGSPKPFEALIGAAQIMQGAILQEKLKHRPPDLLVRPRVDAFRVLSFFKLGQILRAAEETKDEIKRDLDQLLRARSP